jgi:hypothetical protein
MAIWSILRPFGIFVAILVNIFHGHLVHFSSFGILYQEQSGNPGSGFSYPVLKSNSRSELVFGTFFQFWYFVSRTIWQPRFRVQLSGS